MRYNPGAINDDLRDMLIKTLRPFTWLHAYDEWGRLMARALRGNWDIDDLTPDMAVALRRFLDLCERPFSDLRPSRVGGVPAERIRAACMAVWGVPFYAGRGSLTLCEPLALEGALSEVTDAAGGLSEPTTTRWT